MKSLSVASNLSRERGRDRLLINIFVMIDFDGREGDERVVELRKICIFIDLIPLNIMLNIESILCHFAFSLNINLSLFRKEEIRGRFGEFVTD